MCDHICIILVVTPHGDECSDNPRKGEEDMKCTRRWNDFEVDGPRCRSTTVRRSLFV